MILYHVSLEPVQRFIPRVPQCRASFEDSTKPRICLSTSIEKCINAMPGQASSLFCLKQIGIKPVIYVYRFKIRKNAKCLIPPNKVQDFVADAEFSEEYWLIEEPLELNLTVMSVNSFYFKSMPDRYGNMIYPIYNLQCTPVEDNKKSQNVAAILSQFKDNKERTQQLIAFLKKYNLRTILTIKYSAMEEGKKETSNEY